MPEQQPELEIETDYFCEKINRYCHCGNGPKRCKLDCDKGPLLNHDGILYKLWTGQAPKGTE